MLDYSELNPIEPIGRNHDRMSFVSGVSKLDNYLRDRAIGDTEKNISRIFVLTLKKRPATIIGYYSLSALLVPLEALPEEIRKALPNYQAVGTTLLGKLAVAEEWQKGRTRLRLGEHLLIDAMRSSWLASRQVASFALVVDVLIAEKGDPTGFYTRNGFVPFQDKFNRLFLPMTTIEQTLHSCGII